jgi:hypothetical protein
MAQRKYVSATAVTLHDTNEVTGFGGSGWDGMYVGVTGNVTMILSGDTVAVLFKNMSQGVAHTISPKIIHSTATTATDIVVLDGDSRMT